MPSYRFTFFNFDVFYEKFHMLGFQNSKKLLQMLMYMFHTNKYLFLYYCITLEISDVVEYSVYIISLVV
jgi:hypothetical protein